MTAIVTICMGREKYLKQSLPTWLPLDLPIVILDWSCKEPLSEDPSLQHPLVLHHRIPDKQYFNISQAKNSGVEFAVNTFEVDSFLLLDCDVRWDKRTFPKAPEPGTFLQAMGNGLHGSCWVRRDDFLKIGGYDERMEGYGQDDLDLYKRLKIRGLRSQRIPSTVFGHIDHPSGLRTENYLQKQVSQSSVVNARISRTPWTQDMSRFKEMS